MVLSMDRWVGKVAIVTGASAGIGVEIVKHLVDAGLVVVGLARRKELIEQLAQQLSNKKGKLYRVKADMTKEEDIVNAFTWVKENLGPVHILINNAGVVPNNTLIDGDTEKWKKVMDTNVIGLCIATREAVKDMRTNKVDGHIIHINSIKGHSIPIGPIPLNIYPASKFAVTALTETLRLELNSLGSKIKVTSISPGFVESEVLQTMTEDMKSEMMKMPILKPEDIADGVIYVLSTPSHVQVHELMIKPLHETV